MKGMRIAVVVIAVLLVVGLGLALMNSGGASRRSAPTAPERKPVQRAATPRTEGSAPKEIVAKKDRTIAPPPVETPLGMDAGAEAQKVDDLEELAHQAMVAGEYKKALDLRREQNKSAAKLSQFGRSGPIYLEMARIELLQGDYKRVETDLSSVLVMSSVGRIGPDPKVQDDVEVLRAAMELTKGDADKGEATLKKARELRDKAEAADDPAKAEITILEALTADLRGQFEQADGLYDQAFVKMSQARASADHRYLLDNNLWIFEKSAKLRAEKSGPEAAETKRAQERAKTAKETALQK